MNLDVRDLNSREGQMSGQSAGVFFLFVWSQTRFGRAGEMGFFLSVGQMTISSVEGYVCAGVYVCLFCKLVFGVMSRDEEQDIDSRNCLRSG